jgi:hypothetical protein
MELQRKCNTTKKLWQVFFRRAFKATAGQESEQYLCSGSPTKEKRMATIIPFPVQPYTRTSRREDYLQYFYYTLASLANELDMDLDNLEEDFAMLFENVETLVNKHLEIYDYTSEEFGSSDEEVQEIIE